MRFLANENFPLPSVRLLRQAGYDVASVTEDCPGIEDTEVLNRAANEQRVILRFYRDYGELIYRLRLPSPTGVIYLRFRPHIPEEPATLLLNLGICGLIVSQPGGFRPSIALSASLRSTLRCRELSAVETRFIGTLFSLKSLTRDKRIAI
ncbi:MAG: DUF5615 family PIN-like protein [Nostoc sp. EfeVER01]|uniref:DUF5615 family PIN-like protein n=1 Tax=unclassified Nostoc TaxID=2593658 RepID=UPI002AD296EE|nr:MULTISPECIES: DUF5615 family PIN-like protein [unclassified Nostoc]MDZ7946877.1 DUF5615 family PIN-like protein [Nostoc sp. EfeVER01]MDZ7992871.1 DUF5615 family PIN-like protein [Nostoc sp. EspVER01]